MKNFEEYKNKDGTYTSPRNGKTYKSISAFRSHWNFKYSENRLLPKYDPGDKVNCPFCNKRTYEVYLERHKNSCYMNPTNLRLCEVCDKPIKGYQQSKGTCSHSCSNTHFAYLRNKPENYTHYTTICFYHHEKKCIVCGEEKIVAVHHYDENHNNDAPENLIPLCPTHHQYVHSRYKVEVMPIIDKYIDNWKKNREV